MMKNPKVKQTIRPQVMEEAAGWLVEFRAGTAEGAERRKFDAWLRASPEHVRAYLTLLPAWENDRFGELVSQPSLDTLIQWAREPEETVVHLSPRARAAEGAKERAGSRRMFTVAAAAAVVAALGIASYFAFSDWRAPVFATDTGQQTTVTLPDGTTVTLNSRTRIKLRYSQHERRIELQEGQALFQVAKENQRPFIVSSDGTHVRAVGTQFDVYKKPTGTVVTVVEGRVAVLAAATSAQGTLLEAGQQLTVNRSARTLAAFKGSKSAELKSETPTHVNVQAATAWTQRRLIFSATALADVAGEFNRYNSRQLVIDDAPELQSFRINGIFSSADPAALIGFLREQPGIVVTESEQAIHISRNK